MKIKPNNINNKKKTRSDDANHKVDRLLFVFLFTICIYDIRQTNEFCLHSPLPDEERTERHVKTKVRGWKYLECGQNSCV